MRRSVGFAAVAVLVWGCGKSQLDQCKDEVAASCAYSSRCSGAGDVVNALCKSQLGAECDVKGNNRCGLADGGSSGTYDPAKADECIQGYKTAMCGVAPAACAQICTP